MARVTVHAWLRSVLLALSVLLLLCTPRPAAADNFPLDTFRQVLDAWQKVHQPNGPLTPPVDLNADGKLDYHDAVILVESALLSRPVLAGIATPYRHQGALLEIAGAGFGASPEAVTVVFEPVVGPAAAGKPRPAQADAVTVPVVAVDGGHVTTAIPFMPAGEVDCRVVVNGTSSDPVRLTVTEPEPLPTGKAPGDLFRKIETELFPKLMASFDSAYADPAKDPDGFLRDHDIRPLIQEVLPYINNGTEGIPPETLELLERSLYQQGVGDAVDRLCTLLTQGVGTAQATYDGTAAKYWKSWQEDVHLTGKCFLVVGGVLFTVSSGGLGAPVLLAIATGCMLAGDGAGIWGARTAQRVVSIDTLAGIHMMSSAVAPLPQILVLTGKDGTPLMLGKAGLSLASVGVAQASGLGEVPKHLLEGKLDSALQYTLAASQGIPSGTQLMELSQEDVDVVSVDGAGLTILSNPTQIAVGQVPQGWSIYRVEVRWKLDHSVRVTFFVNVYTVPEPDAFPPATVGQPYRELMPWKRPVAAYVLDGNGCAVHDGDPAGPEAYP